MLMHLVLYPLGRVFLASLRWFLFVFLFSLLLVPAWNVKSGGGGSALSLFKNGCHDQVSCAFLDAGWEEGETGSRNSE